MSKDIDPKNVRMGRDMPQRFLDTLSKLTKEERRQMIENWHRYQEDCEYYHRHIDELRKKYPDEIVAIYHRRVVDHDKDMTVLFERLKFAYDIRNMAIMFVPKKKMHYIFNSYSV
jgi:hypothetical protein